MKNLECRNERRLCGPSVQVYTNGLMLTAVYRLRQQFCYHSLVLANYISTILTETNIIDMWYTHTSDPKRLDMILYMVHYPKFRCTCDIHKTKYLLVFLCERKIKVVLNVTKHYYHKRHYYRCCCCYCCHYMSVYHYSCCIGKMDVRDFNTLIIKELMDLFKDAFFFLYWIRVYVHVRFRDTYVIY